jgi:hypothetical protein
VTLRLEQADGAFVSMRVSDEDAVLLPRSDGEAVEIAIEPRRIHLFGRDGRRLATQPMLAATTLRLA